MEEVITEVDPLLLVLVGVLLPLLIAVAEQPSWPQHVRALVSLILVAVVGIGVAWWEDVLTREGITFCVSAVFTLVQVSHAHLWKPTQVTPALEAATSGGDKAA